MPADELQKSPSADQLLGCVNKLQGLHIAFSYSDLCFCISGQVCSTVFSIMLLGEGIPEFY